MSFRGECLFPSLSSSFLHVREDEDDLFGVIVVDLFIQGKIEFTFLNECVQVVPVSVEVGGKADPDFFCRGSGHIAVWGRIFIKFNIGVFFREIDVVVSVLFRVYLDFVNRKG